MEQKWIKKIFNSWTSNFLDNQKMDIADKYKLCFWCLLITGLWPHYTNFRRAVYLVIFYIINLSMLIPVTVRLCQVWCKDFQVMIANIVILTQTLCMVIVYTTAMNDRQNIGKLLSKIIEDWMAFTNEKERDILSKFNKEGKLLVDICSVCSIVGLLIVSSVPIAPKILDAIVPLPNKTRSFLIPFELDYVLFDQNYYYYFFYFHLLFFIFVLLMVYFALISAYLFVVKHSCGLFAITCYRIEKINDIVKNRDSIVELKYFVTKQLSAAIQCHITSISTVELLEIPLSAIFFSTLPLLVLDILLTAFHIIIYLDRLDLLLLGSIILVLDIIYLGFINVVAQLIINSSQDVFYSVYSSDWYQMPPKTRYLIVMMMVRAARPCYLTAGKMLFLSIETYSNILKTTWTYFTVCLSVIDQK